MKVKIIITGTDIELQYESIDSVKKKLWEYFGDVAIKDIEIIPIVQKGMDMMNEKERKCAECMQPPLLTKEEKQEILEEIGIESKEQEEDNNVLE
ncbi:MAG: hypothetical protein ACFFG0_12250 [Candidatus Thorarchaeota archaeon]